MFFTLSYTAHTIISISLHVIGIVVGLFVWYLFPKHPTRSIVQLPSEKVAICIDSPVVAKNFNNAYYTHQNYAKIDNNNGEKSSTIIESTNCEKLIDFDDHHLPPISAIRNFG